MVGERLFFFFTVTGEREAASCLHCTLRKQAWGVTSTPRRDAPAWGTLAPGQAEPCASRPRPSCAGRLLLTAGHAACASGDGGAYAAARLPELGAVQGAAGAGCGLDVAACSPPAFLSFSLFLSSFLSLSPFSFFSSLPPCLPFLPPPSFFPTYVFFLLFTLILETASSGFCNWSVRTVEAFGSGTGCHRRPQREAAPAPKVPPACGPSDLT